MKHKNSKHNILLLIVMPLPINNPNVNLTILIRHNILSYLRSLTTVQMRRRWWVLITTAMCDIRRYQDTRSCSQNRRRGWHQASGHHDIGTWDTPHHLPFVCGLPMNSSNIYTKYYPGGVQCQVWALDTRRLVFRTNKRQTKSLIAECETHWKIGFNNIIDNVNMDN